MDFQDLWVKNGDFYEGNRGRGGAILTPTNSFLFLGAYTSVSNLVKIDKEMRPWEWRHTDRHTHRLTDANRFYYLSHAICYSYGADNNSLFSKHQNLLKFLQTALNLQNLPQLSFCKSQGFWNLNTLLQFQSRNRGMDMGEREIPWLRVRWRKARIHAFGILVLIIAMDMACVPGMHCSIAPQHT